MVQETRLYDSDKDETRSMRSKEEANDYRYFPDPDLLPVEIDEEFIDAVRGDVCRSCPTRRRRDLRAISACPPTMPGVLSASRELGAYFEAVVADAAARAHAKLAANWVMGELSSALNRDNVEITASRVSPAAVERPAGAHRRSDHLGQDRQGGIRGDVVRGQVRGRHHRGAGPEANHRLAAPSKG